MARSMNLGVGGRCRNANWSHGNWPNQQIKDMTIQGPGWSTPWRFVFMEHSRDRYV